MLRFFHILTWHDLKFSPWNEITSYCDPSISSIAGSRQQAAGGAIWRSCDAATKRRTSAAASKQRTCSATSSSMPKKKKLKKSQDWTIWAFWTTSSLPPIDSLTCWPVRELYIVNSKTLYNKLGTPINKNL